MAEHITRRDRRIQTSRKARRARRLQSVLAGLLVMVGIVGGAGLFLAHTYKDLQSRVNTASATDMLDQESRPEKVTPNPSDPFSGPLNFLLIGSDERSGDGGEGGMRSDTVMVAHISEDRERVDIISIPRDSWVEIPSCQLPNGNMTQPHWGKFNAAFSLGGQTGDVGSAVACTIKTVETLTDLYIDDYAVIDFNGFKGMVDALGGVEFNVEEDIIDPGFSNTVIKAGPQTFDGETALRYARVRKAQGMDGSDISRIGRQQELLDAIIQKASDKVTDPTAMYNLAGSTLEMITTSSHMANIANMAGLAWSVKDADVEFTTVPIVDRGDGANVLWTSQADEVWHLLQNDEPVIEENLEPSTGLADGEFIPTSPDGENYEMPDGSESYDPNNDSYNTDSYDPNTPESYDSGLGYDTGETSTSQW